MPRLPARAFRVGVEANNKMWIVVDDNPARVVISIALSGCPPTEIEIPKSDPQWQDVRDDCLALGHALTSAFGGGGGVP